MAKQTNRGNVAAIFSWLLGALGSIVVLIWNRKDKYAVYHAKQSLVLSAVNSAILLALATLVVAYAIVPAFGLVAAAAIANAILVLVPAIMVVRVACAVEAYRGQNLRFPIIASIAETLKI